MEPIAKIDGIIRTCRSLLPADAISEVEHYFAHGEHEMAFEGLVIELMRADVVPPAFAYEDWCALARELGLDKDSVFDGEFWTKFVTWGETK